MAENSRIEWCDHTQNWWIGCTEVSSACDHCYARTLSERYGWAQWGDHPRHRTSAATWRKPLAWNRRAQREGRRFRVFTNSLSDFFDNQVPQEWRDEAGAIMLACGRLDWLVLTKRPQLATKLKPMPWGHDWPAHVWLGTTVENQEEADRRVPPFLAVPAAIKFLSCEPLLGPVDLRQIRIPDQPHARSHDALSGYSSDTPWGYIHNKIADPFSRGRVNWVIVGGESGPHRRPMDLAWARSLRDQCAAAGVAFFGKQNDKVTPLPPDLMIREFPHA